MCNIGIVTRNYQDVSIRADLQLIMLYKYE